MKIKWTDVHEIGYQLSEAHPDLVPLEVRFADLHKMERELPEFDQMAWLEELY